MKKYRDTNISSRLEVFPAQKFDKQRDIKVTRKEEIFKFQAKIMLLLSSSLALNKLNGSIKPLSLLFGAVRSEAAKE